MLKRITLWLMRCIRCNSDLQSFYQSLTPVKPGINGYSKMDRYRDFRSVFGSEAGKRVLAQLVERAEGKPILETEVTETQVMAYRAGQRSIGLWVVQVLQAEPLEEI